MSHSEAYALERAKALDAIDNAKTCDVEWEHSAWLAEAQVHATLAAAAATMHHALETRTATHSGRRK